MSEVEIKALFFDKIAKIVQETDSYWDYEIKSAYMEIDTLVSVGLHRVNSISATGTHECKSCENFDLSANVCLQHDEPGYNENKECLHKDCKDWTQCHGFVPDTD